MGKRSRGGEKKAASGTDAKKKPKNNEEDDNLDEEDDEAYWEAMEAAAAKGGGKKPGDDDDGEGLDESSDSDSDDDGEIKLGEMVTHKCEDFTFEFNDMKASFAEGICTLLGGGRYLMNGTKAYTIAEVIAAQSIVGTTVVCEGGEDVFAFATVLPLRREARISAVYSEFVNPLLALLQGDKKLGDKERKELMLECLSGNKKTQTGVLLHRRFANLPIELVCHLHRNLDEDLGWAKTLDESVDGSGDASSADDHVDFKELTYVLLLCSCELAGAGVEASSNSKSNSSSSSSSGSGSGGGKKIRDVTGSSEILFDYFEDDVYFAQASACYFFHPAATHAGIVATLLPVSSFKTCANEIMKMLPPS